VSEESTTRDLANLVRRLANALSRRDVDALMNFFVPGATREARWAQGMGTFED
jgi:hypothetical protein